MTAKIIRHMVPIETDQFKGDIKLLLENWIALEEQLGFPIQYGCQLKIEYDYPHNDSIRHIRISNTSEDLSLTISFNTDGEYELANLKINDESETFHRTINPFSDFLSKFTQITTCYCEYVESKQAVEDNFRKEFLRIFLFEYIK